MRHEMLTQRALFCHRHEMLTQRAPFCIGMVAKKGTLSQHFVTHVVPPLEVSGWSDVM